MKRLIAALLLLIGFGLFATDLHIASNAVVTTTFGGGAAVLGPSGRVGNWRPDSSIPAGVVVLDAPLAGITYPTDLFTMVAGGTNLGKLTSLPASWVPGTQSLGSPAVTLPFSDRYLGNGWFCPTSNSQPEKEYILFQAQDNSSNITTNANPGLGIDNQVWLYRSADKMAWQLTFYTNLTHGATIGGGVLGPQCSEDSDSANNILHIVYSHIVQGPRSNIACGAGPSTGTCAWFGQFELVYADVNFNGTTPDCSGTGETPCFTLTHGSPVNPRDVVGVPYSPVNGTDGVVSGTGCGSGYKLNSVSQTFSSTIPVGATVRFGVTPPTMMQPYQYSIVSSYLDAHDLCLENALLSPPSTFVLQNMNYMEPHRYLSDGGDLYYSTNSLYILHDSVGAVFNVTNGILRTLNDGYPPGTTMPGASNPTNTWFNEFLTPFPTSTTTPNPGAPGSPQPIGRSIFMSDRAVMPYWSYVPEYSDHYMCGPPNCQIPVRMTEYNTASGGQGFDSNCSTCALVVATRGAWSPDGFSYMTMNQYVKSPASGSYAELHLYGLKFPQAELAGHAILTGHTLLQ